MYIKGEIETDDNIMMQGPNYIEDAYEFLV